jgi:hypothetical protein
MTNDQADRIEELLKPHAIQLGAICSGQDERKENSHESSFRPNCSLSLVEP